MLLLFTLLESLAPALTAAPSCSFCLWLTGCEVRCSQRLHHGVADLLLPPPGKVQTCSFFLLLFFLPDFADRKVLFAVTSDTNLLNKTATSAALFFTLWGWVQQCEWFTDFSFQPGPATQQWTCSGNISELFNATCNHWVVFLLGCWEVVTWTVCLRSFCLWKYITFNCVSV